MLRPGGILGVSESAWIPGDRQLEEQLEEEVDASGPSKPVHAEYLDDLLTGTGSSRSSATTRSTACYGARTASAPWRRWHRSRPGSEQPDGQEARHAAGDVGDYDRRTPPNHHPRFRVSGKDVRVVVSLKNVGETPGWQGGGAAMRQRRARSGTPGERISWRRAPSLPSRLRPEKTATLTREYTLPQAAGPAVGDRPGRERLFCSDHGTGPASSPA